MAVPRSRAGPKAVGRAPLMITRAAPTVGNRAAVPGNGVVSFRTTPATTINARPTQPAATAAGWVGLALIVVAGVVLNETTPFPGTAALLPTVGAALVIISGARPTAFGPARLLGTAIPSFLGRISYSLYLWHWPLLVLPAVAAGVPLPLSERVILVIASVALAAATSRWVEDPFRRGRFIG